jgi:sarcosine oxidase subunit beta
MARKAPALAELTVIRQWAGMYDITPDHLPLVGPTAQLAGWWQANGWSGRGMLLAPYLMELLARQMVGGERAADLGLFEPDRFEPGAADAENGDYYARYAAR